MKLSLLLLCCILVGWGLVQGSAYSEAVEDSYAISVCVGAIPNYKQWTKEELDCKPPPSTWSKIWENDYNGSYYLTDEERAE